MKTRIPVFLKVSALLLVIMALVGTNVMDRAGVFAKPMDAPQGAPASLATEEAALPLETCTFDAGTNTRTCHLWAKTGSLSLPNGVAVPIWGFAFATTDPAQLPGPVIVANSGETLEIVLHNDVAGEQVSLAVNGWDLIHQDFEGVATGSSKTYSFDLTQPGTFTYEAGLTLNGPRQVAMGLFGALIVRPAGQPNQAYADATSSFNNEALVIMSEVDPAFNANPNSFDLVKFNARYKLINGKAYPDTSPIGTVVGNTVLLRYINAGLFDRSVGILGTDQTLWAENGTPLKHPQGFIAKTFFPGQSYDVLINIPAEAVQGAQFALYETTSFLHNDSYRSTAAGPVQLGSLLTFLDVISSGVVPVVGPIPANVMVNPEITEGVAPVTLTADITAGAGKTVAAAEYFENYDPGLGAGIPFAVTPGGSVSVSATIPTSTLMMWGPGDHKIYVRGQDDTGVWGPVSSTVLKIDNLGPAVIGATFTPDPTNGSKAVLLRATADERDAGNSGVTAAWYRILPNGSQLPMTLNRAGMTVTAIEATIPAATIAALPEGLQQVEIVAEDSLGNQTSPAKIATLKLDKTGPATTAVTLKPSTLDFTGAPPTTSVRVEATLSDPLVNGVQDNLVTAEFFVAKPVVDGTGVPMFPKDGMFDEPDEVAYFNIPISNFTKLAHGDHLVYVHGKDAAGNWGPAATATITIKRSSVADKTGPFFSSLTVLPNPTSGAAQVTLMGTVIDPDNLSNIERAEWFMGTDPGIGNGTPMLATDGTFNSPTEQVNAIINVATLKNGRYTFSARSRDTAGNWGPVSSITLRVSFSQAALIMADGFEETTFLTQSVGALSLSTQAKLDPDEGTTGLEVALSANPAYMTYPAGKPGYWASFYFNPNGAKLGSTAVDIFTGLDSSGTAIFGISVQANGDGYELKGWVETSEGLKFTQAYPIAAEAGKWVGLQWHSDPDATFDLVIDAEVRDTLAGLDTSAFQVENVRLGPSEGLTVSAAGSMYFDTFESAQALLQNKRIFIPITLR